MKRILIIGASVLQLPAILQAKKRGFYVGVVDYNPKAIGVRYADEFFNVSTIDIEGVTETARKFKPDGIMTLATDMPMRSLSGAAKACGLSGIDMETAVRATDKGEMIRAFEAAGVEHPWYFMAENREAFLNLLDRVSYPCIMKPTDGSGSKGVILAENRKVLENAYGYTLNLSRGGAVILEEYMTGSEVSVEVMVLDGKPHILQITDKLTTGAPHFVEMGHNQPSMLPKADQEKIRDLATRAVKAIGITCGPAHVEIMQTKEGPKMIELGARMGGDCITTHLVPLSTGIDMVNATMDIACGEKPDITPKFQKGSAIRYFDCPSGVLESISGVEEAKKIPEVREITFVHEPGEKVGQISCSGDRIGFVIAQAETAEKAIEACEKAIRSIDLKISPVQKKLNI